MWRLGATGTGWPFIPGSREEEFANFFHGFKESFLLRVKSQGRLVSAEPDFPELSPWRKEPSREFSSDTADKPHHNAS